jgi:hypothetical protein
MVRFTDAEMAAEVWVAVGQRCEAFWLFGEHPEWLGDPRTAKLCEIEETMTRFAKAEHAGDTGY